MRLLRMAIATGLLVLGLDVLMAAAEAAPARRCPCMQTGSSCVPDLECEARRRAERWRRHYRRSPASVGADPGLAPSSAKVSPDRATASGGGFRAARRPAAAPGPAAAPRPTAGRPSPPDIAFGGAASPARTRLRILETGYSHLAELGKEVDGYGLYSYVILPSDSDRAARFLGEVFREIPSIGDTSAQPSQLNILYIPLRKGTEADLMAMRRKPGRDAEKIGAAYTKSFYDYRMARALLNHVCNPPHASVQDLCNGDLSRGPYIFSYASPASKMEPVPPPFLFVDLSDVHERAFGELLAAFQAQVKREDIGDQARIRTLRLRILDIALTAADWVGPVQKAIADIVRSPGDDDKK